MFTVLARVFLHYVHFAGYSFESQTVVAVYLSLIIHLTELWWYSKLELCGVCQYIYNTWNRRNKYVIRYWHNRSGSNDTYRYNDGKFKNFFTCFKLYLCSWYIIFGLLSLPFTYCEILSSWEEYTVIWMWVEPFQNHPVTFVYFLHSVGRC